MLWVIRPWQKSDRSAESSFGAWAEFVLHCVAGRARKSTCEKGFLPCLGECRASETVHPGDCTHGRFGHEGCQSHDRDPGPDRGSASGPASAQECGLERVDADQNARLHGHHLGSRPMYHRRCPSEAVKPALIPAAADPMTDQARMLVPLAGGQLNGQKALEEPEELDLSTGDQLNDPK